MIQLLSYFLILFFKGDQHLLPGLHCYRTRISTFHSSFKVFLEEKKTEDTVLSFVPWIFLNFLKVWWQDATLFVYFDFITYIHPSPFAEASLHFPHRLCAQWEKLTCGAEPRIELGPALQQALPYIHIFLKWRENIWSGNTVRPIENVILDASTRL